MNKIKRIIETKIKLPLRNLLSQGVAPEKLAWSLSAGFVISFFPIFGTTTSLCILAGIVFRLNHVALQLANYLAYPLQLILILPFIRMGEWIFQAEQVPFDLDQVKSIFMNSLIEFIKLYGYALLQASVAWLIVAVPVLFLVYFFLAPWMRKAHALWIHKGRRR
jgi:uncharacterized protein (DUF2062 family)